MKKTTQLLSTLLLLAGVSFASNTIPFTETFEDGMTGWTGGGVITNSTHSEGESNALSILDTTVTQTFSGTDTNIWISFWADPNPTDQPTDIASGASAVFYVSTSGLLMAFDGENSKSTGASVEDGWNHFKTFCDYSSKKWSLRLNGTDVMTNFAFHGTPTSLTGIEFKEQGTSTALFVDTVKITADGADMLSFSATPLEITIDSPVKTPEVNSSIMITNSSSTELVCSFANDNEWLTVPASLTISPNSSSNLSVTASNAVQDNLTGTFTASYSQTNAFVGNGAFETFTVSFNVGASMSAMLNGVVDDPGFPAPGTYEPGEEIKITITSTNTGAIPINSITNTLVFPSEWNMSSVSTTYLVMANGGAISTVYSVTIPPLISNGSYEFEIRNEATEGSWTDTFSLDVSTPVLEILPLAPTITHVGGGVISGKWEPNERVNISIVSTNSGDRHGNNIINTLMLPPGWDINPAYTSFDLAIGASTTSVYQVTIPRDADGDYTLVVKNEIGSEMWETNFLLEVFSEADPSVSPLTVDIRVAAGGTVSKDIVLTNAGNKAVGFLIADDGTRDGDVSYCVSTGSVGMISFVSFAEPNEYCSTNWSGGSTELMDIGFTFDLFGSSYTNFSINQYGAISFGNKIGSFATSTLRSVPVIASLWGNTELDTNNILFKSSADQLAVAWCDENGKMFQTLIYPTGEIRFMYQDGLESMDARVGVTDGAENTLYVTNINHWNNELSDILLSPQSTPWIQYGSTTGTLNGQNGDVVTFTASPSVRQSGDFESFDATIEWSDGSSDVVSVSVTVLNTVVGFSVSTNSISFDNPVGYSASTNFYLNNTGTVDLAYTILDKTAQINGYTWTTDELKINPFIERTPVSVTDPDEGYSQLIPIGFPFAYFGRVYTHLSVGVNGGISLGEMSLLTLFYTEDENEKENKFTLVDKTNTLSTPTPIFLIDPLESSPDEIDIPDQLIAPYWGDLHMNESSSIEYFCDSGEFVVIWKDMAQKNGGSALTFTAILTKEGEICFQYASLSNSNAWPNTIIGLRDTSDRTFSATLINDTTIVSNDVVESYYSYAITTNGAFAEENPGQVVTNSIFEGYVTNTVVTYKNEIADQTILFTPNQQVLLTIDPSYGQLLAGESDLLTISVDNRSLTNRESVTREFEVQSDEGHSETLTVTFTAKDASTDNDEDGLPNVWEEQYFGDKTIADPNALAANGVNTLREAYVAGLDPTVASSLFLTTVQTSPSSEPVLSWSSISGRVYSVWWSSNLLNGFEITPLVKDLPWTPSVYTDSTHSVNGKRFYKIDVQLKEE